MILRRKMPGFKIPPYIITGIAGKIKYKYGKQGVVRVGVTMMCDKQEKE